VQSKDCNCCCLAAVKKTAANRNCCPAAVVKRLLQTATAVLLLCCCPVHHKTEMLSSTRRPHDLFHHSSPKYCASSCGKVEPSRTWNKAQGACPPKGLGEQVRKLILGVDVARFDAPFCQTVTDEVVPHPDVLAPFMEHGVLGQRPLGVPLLQRLSRGDHRAGEQARAPELKRWRLLCTRLRS
jgi:hypothetical protein